MSADLERRIARLEAIEEIRQLAARYALALDMRDIETLVTLFVDDGRKVFYAPGESGTAGGEALFRRYDHTQRQYTNSQHFVHQHVIEVDDDTHAHGIVYAHCEQEIGEDHWTLCTSQYVDRYERVGGRWLFAERRGAPWYFTPWNEAPVGARKMRWTDRPHDVATLPGEWPTWARFWERGGPDPRP